VLTYCQLNQNAMCGVLVQGGGACGHLHQCVVAHNGDLGTGAVGGGQLKLEGVTVRGNATGNGVKASIAATALALPVYGRISTHTAPDACV
jgi:hypothetical protein